MANHVDRRFGQRLGPFIFASILQCWELLHYCSCYHNYYCSFLQASIESIGESMALAEKNGVDRERVMSILSSSIFDCLIYKVRA